MLKALNSAGRTSVAAAFALLSVAACAQEADTRTMSVPTADLNLTSPQGQAVLHHRLRDAVRDVCGSADPRSMADQADMETCRAAAFADASRQVRHVLAAIRQDPNYAVAAVAPN